MFLIVPATFGTSASALHRHLGSEEPSLPTSVEGASRLALLAAKLLLATAFIVGLVSTIAAST
ncbi:MAG: hypothetical protein QOG66_2290 [Methylobacteriaceae bacterium]|jgi:hypothetical protein|nr:hypothetical protein [Methylobacteriaceae bacterium]